METRRESSGGEGTDLHIALEDMKAKRGPGSHRSTVDGSRSVGTIAVIKQGTWGTGSRQKKKIVSKDCG